MRLHLELIRGQTLTFSGILRDDDGNARDLTSATLVWRVVPRNGCRASFELSEGAGITVTTGTGGQWSITIPPSSTSDLAPGWYVHIGEATIGSAVYGFVSGRLRLRRNVEDI